MNTVKIVFYNFLMQMTVTPSKVGAPSISKSFCAPLYGLSRNSKLAHIQLCQNTQTSFVQSTIIWKAKSLELKECRCWTVCMETLLVLSLCNTPRWNRHKFWKLSPATCSNVMPQSWRRRTFIAIMTIEMLSNVTWHITIINSNMSWSQSSVRLGNEFVWDHLFQAIK